VRYLALSMASYSEYYYSDKGFLPKVLNASMKSRKYILDPDKCATRFVEVVKTADIHFYSVNENLSKSVSNRFLNFCHFLALHETH
jgi:Hormone-sensitive lipase (HSL) N-terminus